MKHAHLVLSFVVLAGLLLDIKAKDVYINNLVASSCVDFECNFFNSSLWVNDTAPEANDAVFIIDIQIPMAIVLDKSINLASVLIDSPVELLVVNGVNVTAANITLSASAQLTIQNQAQIIGTEGTHIHNNSRLNIISGAFAQDGLRFFLDESSSIYVFAAYLGLHAMNSTIYGQLSFTTSSMFYATGASLVFVNQTLAFEFAPTIYNAFFVDSQVSFRVGLRGVNSANLQASTVNLHSLDTSQVTFANFTVDSQSTLGVRGIANCVLSNLNIQGTLLISTSNVNVQGYIPLTHGPLTFGGISSINVSDLYIDDISFQPGENGEAPNVTINAIILTLRDEIDFPQATITASQLASIRGAIHIEGSLQVGGLLHIEDSGLTVYGDIDVGYINGTFFNASVLSIDESQVTVNHLRVAEFGYFAVTASQITGNVTLHANGTLEQDDSDFNGGFLHNHGVINLREPFRIGNYTQESHGSLVSYIELANRSSGYLVVTGAATISGNVLYYVQSPPENDDKITLAVVETILGVKGTFDSSPVELSDSGHKGTLTYSANDVYLVFGKAPKNPASLWWIWFIVAIALVAVIGLIFLLVKTFRRKNYSAVK